MAEPVSRTSALRNVDTHGMLQCVEGLGRAARAAWERTVGWQADFPVGPVVIFGMGGSAISGDLARTLLQGVWPVPITVMRQGEVPAWLGEGSVAIFMSYSGNTAETLAAFEAAGRTACRRLAVTTGGELGRLAAAEGLKVFDLTPGWQPRAALGELYFTLLGVLAGLGAPIAPAAALARLDAMPGRHAFEDGGHQAWRLARTLHAASNRGLVPVVLGASPATEAVALRWKCQFNENSKLSVLQASFPEATHNEIVNLAHAHGQRGPIISLESAMDSPFVRRQREEALKLMGGADFVVAPEAGDLLAQQMELVYLGDLGSVLLGMLRGIDPTPVEAIVRLKKAMATEGQA